MRAARAFGLVASLALASCGEPAAPASPPPSSRSGPLRMVRLLDPGGRLYEHGDRPVWRVRDASSNTWGPSVPLHEIYDRWGFDLTGVTPGSALAVMAHGCRIELATVPEQGEVVVRLRRGLPVPLQVHWSGRLPDGLHEFGVALHRPTRADDAVGPGATLRSIGADWMDHDLPTKLDWTVVAPGTEDVLLYVPEPGRYRLDWVVTWGRAHLSGQASTGRPEPVDVGPEGNPRPTLVAPPADWIYEQRDDAARRTR